MHIKFRDSTLIFVRGVAEGRDGVRKALGGGAAAASSPKAKADGAPGRGLCALFEDREVDFCHAGRWLRLTETGLDPAACAGALASAFRGSGRNGDRGGGASLAGPGASGSVR
jgi:hypothetical protein